MHLVMPIFSTKATPISQQLLVTVTSGLCGPNPQCSKPPPTSLNPKPLMQKHLSLCQQQICLLLSPLGLFLIFFYCEVQISVPELTVHWILSCYEGTLFSSNSHPCCHEMAATAHTRQEILCALFLRKENTYKRKCLSLFSSIIICLVPKCWSWSGKYGAKVKGENQTV